MLTDKNDKCFSLRGYVVPEEKQQSTIVSANINLLDSETNHDFKVHFSSFYFSFPKTKDY